MAGGSHGPAGWRARRPFGRAGWRTGLAVATGCVFLLMTPDAPAAVRLAAQLADANALSAHDPEAGIRASARTFAGTPAVGALFAVSGGALGKHFCSASVVDSPGGDLVITAAHCVTSRAPGSIAFVPGYAAGHQPYGRWRVKRVIADGDWLNSGNPDHDVAFLVVYRPGNGQPVQHLTGGERLGIGWQARAWVQVIGYPDATEQPVTCTNQTRPFQVREMEFDCAGYTDGTSGGPFLARLGRAGTGTVIGVIGGYQQGGDLPAISYTTRFGQDVEHLYQAAIRIAGSSSG
jgi:V8-like Glu-specific endopeptidase